MRLRSPILALSILPVLSGSLFADVTVPALFSEHAVLQKSAKVPIWGSAAPGEAVSVSIAGASAKATANANGKWKTELDLSGKPAGPHTLEIQGKNKIEVKDVLIGEVWVCSGQSNMDFRLKSVVGAAEEIANSTNPSLRQFVVPRLTSMTPTEKLEGKWTSAAPETAAGFTAVGYFFGKKLNKDLQVPVGLISTSWGGTPSEAWTSSEGIDSVPDLKNAKERLFTAIKNAATTQVAFKEAMTAWLEKNGRTDRPTTKVDEFAGPEAKDGWITVKLPGDIATGPGVFWIRREVDVPAEAAGKPLNFEGDTIIGMDTFYWNGREIAETGLDKYTEGYKRRYTIPASEVKAGKSVLAMRLFVPVYAPKVGGGYFKVGNTQLAGDWQTKTEYVLPVLDAEALAGVPVLPKAAPAPQNTATCLFNAMIHPLLPYAIKGAIWYQGEANAGRAFQYRTAFPLMIKDWRAHWQQGDFPFYFVQLANYQDKKQQPEESAWAELREAQTMTLALPNTGMATIIDIGEAKDIHPRNKKDVGERLAAAALAKTYGKSIPYSGPMYDSMMETDGKIRLKFEHTDGGLVAKPLPETYDLNTSKNEVAPLVLPKPDSELQGFAVCGEDKVWKWASAKIEGNDVVVWADEVPQPIAVRYGWAHNPTCNLFNGAGFPAVPFRTDDFPPTTLASKY